MSNNVELESFSCKRCSNLTLIKTCPYLDKRTDDFCEGFHILPSILEEGYEDIYKLSPDDTFRTYAELQKPLSRIIIQLSSDIDYIENNKPRRINLIQRIGYRYTISNLKGVLSDLQGWYYEVQEAMRE